MRRWIALWLVVMCLAMAVGTLLAQGQRQYSTAPPQLVSGSDVGFRIEGTDPRTGRPVGSLMLRIDGRWVEVGSAPLVKPAK